MPPDRIPDVQVSVELEEEILRYLYTEITNAKLARAGMEASWKEINEWYDKTTLDEKKDYPFEGAAHLMIGIIPTFCETIKAKIQNSIWAPQDPFTVRHFNRAMADYVKPLRTFMTWAADNELKLRDVLDPFYLEHLKLGSAVTKVIYEKQTGSRFDWVEDEDNPNNGSWQEIPEIIKDQPVVVHVKNDDFFFQMHVRDLADSEWKAHRFRLSWNGLLKGQRQGKYKNIDLIKSWEEKLQTESDRTTDPSQDPTPVDMTEYELYEVWFEYPLKDGGLPVKMQWFIHLEARVALRKRYNWFPLQMDPFDLLAYEPREHKVYGRGVGQIALPYQKEISTMHNQRLDSVTVRNAPVFKKLADSMLPDFIVFRPGGTIPVNDMDEIDLLFTGQQFDSTVSDEEHTLGMLRERLGLEDFSQDMNVAQSTSILAILAERNRRFDHTIRRVRAHASSVMTKCMLLYQKYYPEGRSIQVVGEDGMLVEMAFKFPSEWIAKGMGIDVTATTASTSRELDRQNKMSLFNLITQYYGQLTQYTLQAQNPQLPEPVRMGMLSIVNALTRFVEDILEDFNLTHAREIAGVIEGARQSLVTAGQQPLAPAGPFGQAGMDALSGAPAQPGGGGGADAY